MINRRALLVSRRSGVVVRCRHSPVVRRRRVTRRREHDDEPGHRRADDIAPAAFVLPAGFEFLVDDTNRITVAVPDTWIDVSTAPTTSAMHSSRRSTPRPTWTPGTSTFGAPGVLYAAFPFTADMQTLIDRR